MKKDQHIATTSDGDKTLHRQGGRVPSRSPSTSPTRQNTFYKSGSMEQDIKNVASEAARKLSTLVSSSEENFSSKDNWNSEDKNIVPSGGQRKSRSDQFYERAQSSDSRNRFPGSPRQQAAGQSIAKDHSDIDSASLRPFGLDKVLHSSANTSSPASGRRTAIRKPQGAVLLQQPSTMPHSSNTGVDDDMEEKIKQSFSKPQSPQFSDKTLSTQELASSYGLSKSITNISNSVSRKPPQAPPRHNRKSYNDAQSSRHQTPTPVSSPSESICSTHTSPSHGTSFSSSPNDSPLRKPSFSSSQTSPTHKVSFSSSSTDSPTHKLFVSYRKSPSHRTGYTSPQRSNYTSPVRSRYTSPVRSESHGNLTRQSSFSSSSHESPVRKPSFSSSDSQHKQLYSSTTSSQSSTTSSPSHAPSRRVLSPDVSPTRVTLAFPQSTVLFPEQIDQSKSNQDIQAHTFRIQNENMGSKSMHAMLPNKRMQPSNIEKYGRPLSPKMDSVPAVHHDLAPITSKLKQPNTRETNQSAAFSSAKQKYWSQGPEVNQRGEKNLTKPTLKPTSLALSDSKSFNERKVSPSRYSHRNEPEYEQQLNLDSLNKPVLTSPSANSGVRGLVGNFEGRSKPIETLHRSGGPQAYSNSPSPSFSHEAETSFSLYSNRFSPPAYTYSSPISSTGFRDTSSPPPLSYTSPFPHPYMFDNPASQVSTCTPSPAGTPNSDARSSPFPESRTSYDGSSRRSSVTLRSEDSPPPSTVYIRCESSDSLSATESSSLLKKEDKSQSLSSLYYADEDIPDIV